MSDLKRKNKQSERLLKAFYVDESLLIDEPWLDPVAAAGEVSNQGCAPFLTSAKELSGYEKSNLASRAFAKTWLENHGKEWEAKRVKVASRRPFSLSALAVAFGKSHRTIQRYCENGVIPKKFLKQTNGGHWRVSRSRKALAVIRKSMSKFERNRRGKSARTEGSKRASIAKEIHSTLGKPLAPKSKIPAPIKNLDESMLFLMAQKIFQKSGSVSAVKIASAFHISRASLYRYFSSDEIRLAKIMAKSKMEAKKIPEEETQEDGSPKWTFFDEP